MLGNVDAERDPSAREMERPVGTGDPVVQHLSRDIYISLAESSDWLSMLFQHISHKQVLARSAGEFVSKLKLEPGPQRRGRP